MDIKNNKGMAVILALSVVLLLVTAALELHMNERNNMFNAAVMRDRATLTEMATSGIHLGMAMLIKDRLDSEVDSLQEDWADAQTIAGLIEEMPFDQGKVELKIIDEMSKIQINSLVQFPQGRQFNDAQRRMWERFSGALIDIEEMQDTETDTDPITIINSLKDWLDSGDDDAITGLSGAESDYYEALDPPYKCKNGPFDHLSEVRLVKGITPELFNGFGGAAGLGDYITVYGAEKSGDQGFSYPGKININTAELPVLSALLPLESANFAEGMVEYREAMSGSQYTYNLTDINWYKNVPGLSDVTLDSSLISISSDIFRLICTAKLNEVQLTITAVVQREKPSESAPWHCKVLNWKTE
ncbi:MAG: general secretion pathway protein GspK [Desulfosarcinaceae bacterium]